MGINTPTQLSERLLSSFEIPTLEAIEAEPPNPLDLSTPPTKSVDTWRIEGEDPDLHLHRPEFHFPLICLRAL